MALAQQQKVATSTSRPNATLLPPRVVSGHARMPLAPLPVRSTHAARHARLVARAATEESAVEVKPLGAAAAEPEQDNWVPVCKPEDLPKGVRKEAEVDDRQVLLFWYRNQIYCIESRSPAEGAYSEGFIKAKFTQDFCIECPSTGTLFSLKDGSIVSWYPNNPVLRALTPANLCRPLEMFPVKLSQEAIYVDVSAGTLGGLSAAARGRGGAGTSVENNNVFAVQPTVYFEGMDPTKEAASVYADAGPADVNPAIVIAGITAVGGVAVAGTAFAIYYENLTALIAFWVVFGIAVGVSGFNYVNRNFKKDA